MVEVSTILWLVALLVIPYLYFSRQRNNDTNNHEKGKEDVKPPPNSKFITLSSGIKIRYTDTGIVPSSSSSSSNKSNSFPSKRGDTITFFCIHGFGGCLETWNPLTKQLETSHRVISVDLPANGWSQKKFNTISSHDSSPSPTPQPLFNYTFRDKGKVVTDMIYQMDLKNVVLIGHSSGCIVQISSPSTKQTHDRVIGSILVAPGIFHNNPPQKTLELFSYSFMTPIITIVARIFISRKEKQTRAVHKNQATLTSDILDPFLLQTKTKDYLYGFRSTMQAYEDPYVDLVKDVVVPLHFVWSDEDTLNPPAQDQVLALMKDQGGVLNVPVSMSVLTNSNHYIQHEQPELLAKEVIRFIQKL